MSLGLLFTVLLAPVLSFAIWGFAATAAKSGCSHCAMMKSAQLAGTGSSKHGQAPAAPCCERSAPVPLVSGLSAQIVVPMQVALMPTASVVAYLVVTAAPRVETVATPPQLKSPLSLLCTLLI